MSARIEITAILEGKKMHVIVKDQLFKVLLDGEKTIVLLEDSGDLRLEEFSIGSSS